MLLVEDGMDLILVANGEKSSSLLTPGMVFWCFWSDLESLLSKKEATSEDMRLKVHSFHLVIISDPRRLAIYKWLNNLVEAKLSFLWEGFRARS